jgi:hypothetical protein
MNTSKAFEGFVNVLWLSSWADNEEENGRTYSGMKIEDVAPPCPASVRKIAKEYVRLLGKVNGVKWKLPNDIMRCLCYLGAIADNDVRQGAGDTYSRRFGECLAYMALGHGISWFDDHQCFDLKVPSLELNVTDGRTFIVSSSMTSRLTDVYDASGKCGCEDYSEKE